MPSSLDPAVKPRDDRNVRDQPGHKGVDAVVLGMPNPVGSSVRKPARPGGNLISRRYCEIQAVRCIAKRWHVFRDEAAGSPAFATLQAAGIATLLRDPGGPMYC